MKSTSLILTDVEFCGWLGQAAPGDILQYHRGYIALDASPNGGSLGDYERRELGRVARRARWAAERQLVHLVQRRHAANDFSYLAIARPRPKTIPASSLPLQHALKG